MKDRRAKAKRDDQTRFLFMGLILWAKVGTSQLWALVDALNIPPPSFAKAKHCETRRTVGEHKWRQ